MLLGEYLKKQHMEYCYQHNEMISEKAWVNDVLNPQLPTGERIRYPSFNQWVNNERIPDVRNMLKLMQLFGPEVLTVMSVDFPSDLAQVLARWDRTTQEDKQTILEILNRPTPEPATLQA